MDKMDLDSSTTEINQSKGNEVKISDGVEFKINVKASEKNLKRKRTSLILNFQNKDKETIVAECNKEMGCLLEYYKELSGKKIILDDSTCSSNNSLIACSLEESSIAFSKLVNSIYEKLNGKGVTLAYVRSTVLSVGQRMMYGVPIEDADVLEDESESCLWCWETRDMKLLPFNNRGELNARRLGRKKIHERISSLSAILSVLAIPEDQTTYKTELCKTFTKLGKTLNLEEIHSVVEKKKQKSNCSMAEKAAKLKEKELICTHQKENLNNEKEIKLAQEQSEKDTKMHDKEEAVYKKQLRKQQEEAERTRKRQEKEEAEHQRQLKKQQEEAERNRKRQEKEDAEHQKQLKKQEEEAEKSRKRREKEEAELKKQNSVKKQATILEKFLKTNKSSTTLKGQDKTVLDEQMQNSLGKEEAVDTIISLMDNALCQEDNPDFEDIKKFHDDSWRKLRRNHTSCYWGARKNPKVALVKELKLHELSSNVDLFGKAESPIKEAEQVDENFASESESTFVKHTDTGSHSVWLMRKKLLQFDKSNRPAYYGTWSKKSYTVGPRHPFKQDPELDYDVDSDEEWEEEEPGESLSDCEKETEEEHVEEDLKIEDEEESEDGFVVPDGYLSENEGVQVDEKPSNNGSGTLNTSDQSEIENEEVNELLQQQKYLRNLTEHALSKGHPLIISNLTHEKSALYNTADAVNGNIKMEIKCLQALCMQSCMGGIIIDLSVCCSPENEGNEVIDSSQDQSNVTPSNHKLIISDSDLLEYAKSIQSHPLAMAKILESLHAKFPSISKAQLRSKVKEISEYIDNQWKVKKEILAKLGLSSDSLACQSPGNQADVMPSPPKSFISDSDLIEYVKIIRSCSLGINKIVDSIHAKFPSISKTQLRSKVREISDYVDNRWIVKKEILTKLGLSTTPGKAKPRGIASFFLKRFQSMNQETVNMEKKPSSNENVSLNNGIEASTPKKD